MTATAIVTSTNTGHATNITPATRSESANGDQLVVPRNISARFSHRVVTNDDSMKSVNGGAYRPNTNSGPIHHELTTAHPTNHAAANPATPRREFSPGHASNRQASATPAGRQAASVAVALTAPISATGIRAAATQRQLSRAVRNAVRTQGASMTGQVSEEIAVSVLSVRGDRA